MNNNFVTWNHIFSDKGVLIPEAKEIIHSSRSLHLPQLETPGASIVWHKKHVKQIIFDDKNILSKISGHVKGLNGSAAEHEFSVIQLPQKHVQLQSFKKELGKFSREEQMESPIGRYVLESFRNDQINFKFILNLVQNIPFFHLVGKHQNEVVFQRIPTSYETSGIYLIREYAPGDPCGITVYTGMSVGYFLKTIKAHFYKRKEHWNYRHHHERGEDRGKWIEKINTGYAYSVGILPMKIDTDKQTFFSQIKMIETNFIHALHPRDNGSENIYKPEQGQLFEESEIPGYISDNEQQNSQYQSGPAESSEPFDLF